MEEGIEAEISILFKLDRVVIYSTRQVKILGTPQNHSLWLLDITIYIIISK